jgi:hypothetical protein
MRQQTAARQQTQTSALITDGVLQRKCDCGQHTSGTFNSSKKQRRKLHSR